MTLLLTNHGLCGVKKHLVKLEDSPKCEVCNKNDDLEHIQCEKFKDMRNDFPMIKDTHNFSELIKEKDSDKYRYIVKFYNGASLNF